MVPCLSAAVVVSVKAPWQFLRAMVQGSAEAPVRFAAAISAWSSGTPVTTRLADIG